MQIAMPICSVIDGDRSVTPASIKAPILRKLAAFHSSACKGIPESGNPTRILQGLTALHLPSRASATSPRGAWLPAFALPSSQTALARAARTLASSSWR